MGATLRPYLSCQHLAASMRVKLTFPLRCLLLVTFVSSSYLRNLAGFNYLAHNT